MELGHQCLSPDSVTACVTLDKLLPSLGTSVSNSVKNGIKIVLSASQGKQHRDR